MLEPMFGEHKIFLYIVPGDLGLVDGGSKSSDMASSSLN